MMVHISSGVHELLMAAAFVKELLLLKLAYTSDLALFLYISDDYMVNVQLRADDAWIISPFTYNVIVYAILLISGIISTLTNPLHVL